MIKILFPWLFSCLLLLTINASEGIAHVFSFNGNTNGWQLNNISHEKNIGRAGGSLHISTYVEGGRQGIASSPFFKVQGRAIDVGTWAAQNMVYAQEPFYCAILTVLYYDKDKNEISRYKLIDFAVEEKKDFLEGVKLVPEGLFWKYYHGQAEVPANAEYAKLFFSWAAFYTDFRNSEAITGETFIDDISVAFFDSPMQLSSKEEKAKFTLKLGLKTPAEINLFDYSDPLEFDALLFSEEKKDFPGQLMNDEIVLHYIIRDYNKLIVDQGEVIFNPKKPWWALEPYNIFVWNIFDKDKKELSQNQGIIKKFYLKDKVKTHSGKWLELACRLTRNNQTIARGDISFAILKSDHESKGEDPEKFHFLRGHANGEARNFNYTVKNHWLVGDPPENPWAPGKTYPTWLEKINSKGIAWMGWANWQVLMNITKDGSADFSTSPDTIKLHQSLNRKVSFEERIPAYTYHAFIQQQKFPEWAVGKRDGRWDFDAQVYADYLKKYAEHTPCTVFMPFGCEAVDSNFFADAISLGAKAIKSVDPRLKVAAVSGFSRKEAEDLDRKILDNVDIFVDDIYNQRVDANGFKEALKQRGYRNKEVYLQEHCDMVGRDLISRSIQMVRYNSYALAHGVDKIFWWSVPAEPSVMLSPNANWSYGPELRGKFSITGDRAFCAGWRTLGEGIWPSERYHYPFPELITQYHLNNYLGFAELPEIVDAGEKCEFYRFSNRFIPGYKNNECTVITAFLDSGEKPRAIAINSGKSFTLTDIYGNTTQLTPSNDRLILTLSEKPIIGNFIGKLDRVELGENIAEILMPEYLAPAGKILVTLRLKNNDPEKRNFTGIIIPKIDQTWIFSPASSSFSIPPGKTEDIVFELTVPENVQGTFPMEFGLFDSKSGKQFGIISHEVTVTDNLSFDVQTVPAARKGEKDRLNITLRNNTSNAQTGTLEFINPITRSMRPEKFKKSVIIPANQIYRETIEFEVPCQRNAPYEFFFTFTDENGMFYKLERELFFIGIPRRKTPILIDGDYSDWPLEQLIPLQSFKDYFRKPRDYSPFKSQKSHGCMRKGNSDSFFNVYLQYDDEFLYLLAIIDDDVFMAENPRMSYEMMNWSFDKLHVSIYPWSFINGTPVKAVAYKEEFGFGKDEKPGMQRRQASLGGIASGHDIQFAARKANQKYIFEIAYPKSSLIPFDLKKGSAFRMNIAFHDLDEFLPTYIANGVIWFGGGANVSGSIELFGEVTLVE